MFTLTREARQVLTLAREKDIAGGIVAGRSESSAVKAMGRKLSQLRDRRIGDYVLRRGSVVNGQRQYHLELRAGI